MRKLKVPKSLTWPRVIQKRPTAPPWEHVFSQNFVSLTLQILLTFCMFKIGKKEFKESFGAPLVLDLLEGKWLKFCISPTTGPVHSIQGLTRGWPPARESS
eukprot:485747-Pelagomonas_calceolata.AAC.1